MGAWALPTVCYRIQTGATSGNCSRRTPFRCSGKRTDTGDKSPRLPGDP